MFLRKAFPGLETRVGPGQPNHVGDLTIVRDCKNGY